MRRRNRRIRKLKRGIRRREEEKRSGGEIKLKKDIRKKIPGHVCRPFI
jgi:hypothetical protein